MQNLETKVLGLGKQLCEAMLKLKEGNYCIVNRLPGGHFIKVFADSLWEYRDDVVLMERAYKREKCSISKQPVSSLSEEDEKIYNEYRDFVVSFKDEQDTEKIEEMNVKLAEYQEKLKDLKPIVTEQDVLTYHNGITKQDYLVTPLSEIEDDVIELISNKIANFVFNYFSTMLMIPNWQINAVGVVMDNEDSDFIDICSAITI